jgi:hypothetical protein
VKPAPRPRQLLAGLIDATVIAALGWGVRRTGRAGDTQAAMRVLAAAGQLAREQLRSPGQRLLGLRTVDARTGRRVALWRTLVVVGADSAGEHLARRLAPPAVTPEQERERERFLEELAAIHERHRDDPEAAEAERRLLYRRHPPVTSNMLRAMAPGLTAGLVNRRLRRRLAPTAEVRDRGRGRHSP